MGLRDGGHLAAPFSIFEAGSFPTTCPPVQDGIQLARSGLDLAPPPRRGPCQWIRWCPCSKGTDSNTLILRWRERVEESLKGRDARAEGATNFECFKSNSLPRAHNPAIDCGDVHWLPVPSGHKRQPRNILEANQLFGLDINRHL